MNTVELHTHVFGDDGGDYYTWREFDQENLTGRWKMLENGDLFIEIKGKNPHSWWNAGEYYTQWLPDDAFRFSYVHEPDQ